jgi:hypothetical protein
VKRRPGPAGGDGEASEVIFETLGRLARAGAPGVIAGKNERRARSRFLAQVARRRLGKGSLVLTLAVSALMLGGWRWLHQHDAARISQPVARALPAPPRPVADTPAPPAPLLPGGSLVRFADGSELRFDAEGRGRIIDTTKDGARVRLEEGGVTVHVVHHQGTSWRIEAGPFAVRVTGTSFRVGWQKAAGRFDLAMTEGAVLVEGPTFSQRLVAGQVLQASATAGIVHLAWAQKPRSVRAGHAGRSSRTAESAVVPWSRRLALGNFRDVVDEASAAGIELVFARRGLDDLSALATAARLSGETELARRALAAVRGRFPGTPAAAEAAFLLGRLAEDVDHNPAAAVLWYERAYSEVPTGALAPEALGRKLGALQSDGADASAAARLYLQRFPAGPHAVRARALAGVAPLQ